MSILSINALASQPKLVGAGFWIRALARLVDLLHGYLLGLAAGFAGVIALLVLQILSIAAPGWQYRLGHARPLLFVMSLIGSVLYATICEAGCGATVGKLVCGVRVLAEDETPCSLRSAFIRSLAYFVDSIAFGLVGYLSMNKTLLEQRHGDHWAGTVVVRRGLVPEASRRSTLAYWGAIAGGSFAWMLPLSTAVVLSAMR